MIKGLPDITRKEKINMIIHRQPATAGTVLNIKWWSGMKWWNQNQV